MTIIIIKDKQTAKQAHAAIDTILELGTAHEISIVPVSKKRTVPQNSAIFRYYRIIAAKLNDSGYTSRSFFDKLRSGFEVPVAMEDIRKVTEKVSMDTYHKEVKELTTVELPELHKIVDKGFSISIGVSSDFPSSQTPTYNPR